MNVAYLPFHIISQLLQKQMANYLQNQKSLKQAMVQNQGFHRNSGLQFTYGNNPEIFPFPLWKKFRIPERFPERFFSRKPEISGTLFRNSGSLRNSRTFRNFRNVTERSGNIRNVLEYRSGKIVPEISETIGTRIKLKPLRLM